MKYYFAKAYKKVEGKRRYRDITEKDKSDNCLGMVIVQDKGTGVQEISTKLKFDVYNSCEKIKYDMSRIESLGRDIYVDDIDYDREVTPSALSTYMWVSVNDGFCLYPELLLAESQQKQVQKVYKA